MIPHPIRRLLPSAGADCAGIIADRAPSATPGHEQVLCAGEAVFGLARGSLGSHAEANTTALARMPPAVEPEQASAAPTVFITAELALCDAVQNLHTARCGRVSRITGSRAHVQLLGTTCSGHLLLLSGCRRSTMHADRCRAQMLCKCFAAYPVAGQPDSIRPAAQSTCTRWHRRRRSGSGAAASHRRPVWQHCHCRQPC